MLDIEKAQGLEDSIQKTIETLRGLADKAGKLELGYAEVMLLEAAHGKVRQALREVRAAIAQENESKDE